MKLLTYRLEIRKSKKDFRTALHYLYDSVLQYDQHWHFFRDEEGITLRFSRKYKKAVVLACGVAGIKFKIAGDYQPEIDEYEEVRFTGDCLIGLFHATSVANVLYPPDVVNKYIIERVNHAIVNQSGVHSFYEEAKIYSDLALGRAQLGGMTGRGKWYHPQTPMPIEEVDDEDE